MALRLACILFLGLGATGLTRGAPGPGAEGTYGSRRAVIFGIDGCRSDALKLAVENGTAPHIAGLIREGAVSWRAFAGGVPGTPTQQATLSGPGWASVLTGVWTNKHGVTDNGFAGKNLNDYPHFFRRLRDADAEAELVSLVSWPEIHDHLTGGSGGGAICACHTYTTGNYDQRDAILIAQTVNVISGGNPDVIFCYQGNVDIAGHNFGFHPTVPAYMASIAVADRRIGLVLEAIRARPRFEAEDWLFIVTSDHGGTGTSHGGQSDEERIIPLVVSGGDVPRGLGSRNLVGQVAVPATVYRHLRLEIPAIWAWESDAYLIGASLTASTGARSVFLSWNLPAAGIAGLGGFELRRNGTVIATLGVDERHFTDGTQGAPGSPLVYSLRLLGSNEADLMTVAVAPGNIEMGQPPVLHLPFNGSLADASGRGNDARAEGAMGYVAGKSGQALVIDGSRSARIGSVAGGAPGDLLFGTDVDFTLSFWFKANASWSGDPAIISNKSWVTGGNQGWIVAGENNGNDWQWNLTGAAQPRKDFDPSDANIAGSAWRLVTVTHDRDGNAEFYHDGIAIGRVSIAGAGNVDTAFPVRIGRDGSNAYPWNQGAFIDELKIWRRALSPAEVATEFGSGDPTSRFAIWMGEQAELYAHTGGLLAPGDDPDGDGSVNLMEFAGGTLPFSARSRSGMRVESVSGGGLRIRFPQRNGGSGIHGFAEGYRADGLRYLLEAGGNLDESWMPATGIAVQNDAASFAGFPPETHEIAVDVPAVDAKEFFRLRVMFDTP